MNVMGYIMITACECIMDQSLHNNGMIDRATAVVIDHRPCHNSINKRDLLVIY